MKRILEKWSLVIHKMQVNGYQHFESQKSTTKIIFSVTLYFKVSLLHYTCTYYFNN